RAKPVLDAVRDRETIEPRVGGEPQKRNHGHLQRGEPGPNHSALNRNPRSPWPDGINITIDSFVHDPDGRYVQFELDVLDFYGGTYRVGLTPASAIVVPTDGSPVFDAD
ncbi:hypothetical protein, partial [Nocardioides sp. NPDC000441]|uniref:hypothetical protein n=1 Tax=Nocardioides sp. NPDC000441 TaxID=3154256 RepID=UPI00331BAC3D